MESWEFLLQKRGDKSWLPLEVPTVEILEGQYRLAAKSSFIETPIGIQIRYSPSAEVGYKPLQQKISKRTNPEGLLIVTPYTHLTPGTWQIFCFAIAPNAGTSTPKDQKPWSTSIRFDVLPISPELAIEMQLNHPDWAVDAAPENAIAADSRGDRPSPSQPASFQTQSNQAAAKESAISAPGDRLMRYKGESSPNDQLSQSHQSKQPKVSVRKPAQSGDLSAFESEPDLDLDADLRLDLDRSDQDSAQGRYPEQDALARERSRESVLDHAPADLATGLDDIDAPESEAIAPSTPQLPHQLINLDQSQFLVSAGQLLQITGQVYVPGTIAICLKDPSDLRDLALASLEVEIDHELAEPPAPPFRFGCEMQIPILEQSQVMIGEVRLHPGIHPSDLDLEPSLDLDQRHITHQPITVTYQSANILAEAAQAAQAIANLAEAEIEQLEQSRSGLSGIAREQETNLAPVENNPETITPEPTTAHQTQNQISLPITPQSIATNQAAPDTPDSIKQTTKQTTSTPKPVESIDAIAPDLKQDSNQSAAEAKPPARKPLAIPELPSIARQDHAEKQRRAAAKQNAPSNPSNTPENASTKPGNIDLPPLPKLTKIEAAPLQPLPPDPQPNNQFEDIWGVQPPAPKAPTSTPQPSQAQSPPPQSQPSLPKIAKSGVKPPIEAEGSPLDQIKNAESGIEAQSTTNTDNPESEESELRYGFEEDELQYSFEDPHDFDDPAIAISSDALEFWEDAMRSPEPLSLADTPEELLAIPEILGITNPSEQEEQAESDRQQTGDDLDQLAELEQIADLNPRFEND
jgi:hypothetical protein